MFKAGDLVEVKSWEEMEEEFGLDWDDSIDCEFSFTSEMEYLCGVVFKIYKVDECDGEIIPDYNSCFNGLSDFCISKDMIKLADTENIKVGDLLEIKSWSEMEEEFGIDAFNSIDCEFAFLPDMKHLCGKKFVLSDIVFDSDSKEYELIPDSDYDENHELSGWSISKDMVKIVKRGER